jgi:glycosyltransferase involved in cell wall biosynthesis
MRIAIIGPPFIEIPPRRYGGTELFIANLACELHACGHDVSVYTNGDSRLPCGVRWMYEHADWPIANDLRSQFKNANHTAWAIEKAAAAHSDIIHLNDLVGLPMTRFVDVPTVLTIHHPHEPLLSEQYLQYPEVEYVAIAGWLAQIEPMPHVSVVPHGIPARAYTYSSRKEDYVAFLGRMAPCKGPHLAIAAARRAGVRLKLAGEIQPLFRDYWEREVRPLVDGREVEYVGEADFAAKCALLSKARALLFPIQWDEPFGLVMIEAMACGTPVLAFRGGSVDEIVRDGVNGWICRDVDDMAARLRGLDIPSASCRGSVETSFTVARMADAYADVYARALDRSAAPLARGA